MAEHRIVVKGNCMKTELKDAGQYVVVVAGIIVLSMLLQPWLVITIAAWDLLNRGIKVYRDGR